MPTGPAADPELRQCPDAAFVVDQEPRGCGKWSKSVLPSWAKPLSQKHWKTLAVPHQVERQKKIESAASKAFVDRLIGLPKLRTSMSRETWAFLAHVWIRGWKRQIERHQNLSVSWVKSKILQNSGDFITSFSLVFGCWCLWLPQASSARPRDPRDATPLRSCCSGASGNLSWSPLKPRRGPWRIEGIQVQKYQTPPKRNHGGNSWKFHIPLGPFMDIYGVFNIRMMGLLACWVLEQLYPEKATKRPTDWWIFRVTGRGTVWNLSSENVRNIAIAVRWIVHRGEVLKAPETIWGKNCWMKKVHSVTDSLVCWSGVWWIDSLNNWLTGWLPDWLTCWVAELCFLIDSWTYNFIDQTDVLIDWLTDWLVL